MSPRPFRWPYQTAGKAITTEAVDAAWREYRATRSEAARETLLQRYIHLVRYMASRLVRTLPPSVEADDLISAGTVGFIAALEGFDPSVGTDFSVYALTRIRGAMVDFVRDIDPLGRVTRRRLREMSATLIELEQELGHMPSDAETAARLGVPLDAYHDLMAQATASMTLSLDRLEAEGDDDGESANRARVPDHSVKGALTSLIEKESGEQVAAMVAKLSTAQQLVLHLHYVEELNFREIAMVMDISESRATQLHSAAVVALRTQARRLASV